MDRSGLGWTPPDAQDQTGTETGTKRPPRAQARTFTDAYIKALKPRQTRYKQSEWAPKGEGRLTVLVEPDGSKTFFYRYRANGQDRTIKCGRYGDGRTLADIRKAYRKHRDTQAETGDVKEHFRAEQRRKEIERRKGSFEQLLIDGYVDALRKAGKPSANAVEGIFRRNVIKPFPTLAATKAKDIGPDDVQTILARMVRKGIERQVNVTRSYLHAAFQWGAEADHDPRRTAAEGVKFGLTTNPVLVVPVIKEFEKARTRTLSEEELREFWNAIEALPLVQKATLRFNLALASQRPTQLLRAEGNAFDFKSSSAIYGAGKRRLWRLLNSPQLLSGRAADDVS